MGDEPRKTSLLRLSDAACVLLICGIIAFCPYSQKISKYLFFAAVFFWLLSALLRKQEGVLRALFPATPVNRTLLFFTLACFVSILFSANPHQGQKIFFARYVWYFILFFMAAGIAGKKERAREAVLWTILAASAYMGAGGIWDQLTRHPIRLYTVFGTLVPFHMLPLFLTYLIPMNFAVALFSAQRKFRITGLLNTILLCVCLFFQESRAGYVAVALSILLLTMLKSRKAFILGCCALLFTTAAGFLHNSTRKQLQTIPFPSQWNYRVPLYDSALAIFRDNPVTGAGIGMYQLLIKQPRYSLPADYPSENKDDYLHAHNTYFEIMAEMGIIGLLAFLGVFAAFFHAFSKTRHDPLVLAVGGMITATLVYAVSGSIILVGVSHTFMFWLLFGAASGMVRAHEG